MAAGTVAAAAAVAGLVVAAVSVVVARRRGLARPSGAESSGAESSVVGGRISPTGRTAPPAPSNEGVPGPARAGSAGDLDDAVTWALRHLPGQVGGQLNPGDIRRIMGWNLDYFRSRETSGNGHSPHSGGPVVVAGAEAVAWVLDRAGASGRSYTAAQVHAVLEVQMTYLEALGVVEPDPPS